MADEITQADRELLAAEYERNGLLAVAKAIRANRLIRRDAIALRAIAAARRQGQVPSGGEVVPVAWRTRHRDVDWSFTTRPHPGDIARGIWQPLYTAPPSAPVGMEGLVESLRFAAARWNRESAYHASGVADDYGAGQRYAFLSCATEMTAIIDQALAQQPAAVGGFDAWFDEYSKQNYSEEMLAKAAWDAALAAQQEGAP